MHISTFTQPLVFALRKEEKIVAQLVYSSFRQVAAKLLRGLAVFTSNGSPFSQDERKLSVNTA